jgi:hypothetical protein
MMGFLFWFTQGLHNLERARRAGIIVKTVLISTEYIRPKNPIVIVNTITTN